MKEYYKYLVLVAIFTILLLVYGLASYSFSLFVNPIESELGWARSDIFLSLTVYNMVMICFLPFVGKAINYKGLKFILSIGTVAFGSGFLLLGLINSAWQFYIIWGLIGFGAAAIGLVPTTTLILTWFKKHTGLALGVMGAAVGTGGFIVAPIVGYLIPEIGWRNTYFVMGIFAILIICPLALFILKTKPADVKKGEASLTGLSLKEAKNTTAFWLMTGAFLLLGFSQMAIFMNHAPRLLDIGFTIGIAASAISVVGFGSSFGKFFFGILCNWMNPKYVLTLAIVLEIAAVFILISIDKDSSLALIYLYSILYGLGIGCWLPSIVMLTKNTFGLAHYSANYGVFFAVLIAGNSIGPYIASVMYGATNSYNSAFILILIAFVLAVAMVMFVRGQVKR